jgi:predicted ATPase/class 3 adenylate cyclase/tetratricopeptide (TPR) repeat protein
MNEERALLLTDLVDSTQLAATIGDAEAAAWNAAHDRVARDLLRLHHGREIDKTDGMLMLFEQVSDAAAYALAYHAALAALPVPLKSRVGLHVGRVILRANSVEDVAHGAKPLEVEGIAKPVAARIMSLALGGQTLLSAEARAALGGSALRLQSHGFWRIKGLVEPVELFELGDERAPFTPPPDSAKVYRVVRSEGLWLPLRQVRNNLPAERDGFVGREQVLVDLARRFDGGARLVSLLGIGGAGKTRLALRFARTWLGDYPGGVWFCDLSPARDLDGLVRAVSQALDVPLGKDDPVVQLGHAIAGRGRCLVLLDNFEQIARHAEDTIGRWLDRAVEACFLVTTREVLGLPGEEALALAPLGIGDAVALFVRRAAAARLDFAPSAVEQAVIEQLVQLLDGLPLAIELAASRVRVMSPATMLSRMNERFKLLASAGGRKDRQATLRAAFDWSWDLLDDTERATLAQLSVFEGSFNIQAADAVLELPAGSGRAWTPDLLHSLADKSLLQHVQPDRLGLLSSVKAYAAEQLGTEGRFPASGAAAQRSALARHGAWFATLGPRRAKEHACADLSNLVAACKWAVEHAASAQAVGALQGAWAALSLYGPFSVGVDLAAAVCSLNGLDDAGAALAHEVHGYALDSMGRPADARIQFEAALRHAQSCRDIVCQSKVMTRLALLRASEGQMAAAGDQLKAALALALQTADVDAQCAALNGLANVEIDMGRLDGARACYEDALARARDAKDEWWQCGIQGNLGMLHANVGHLEEANACLIRALDLARSLGDRQREGNQLCNLGMLHMVRRQIDDAIRRSEEALVVVRELGHKQVEAIVQCNLGLALDEAGRTREALEHFDAALRTLRELGQHRYEGQTLGYLGRALAKQGQLDAARACFDKGQVLLTECADPLSLGILLCDRAKVELRAQGEPAARQVLDRARAIAVTASVGPESELGQAIAEADALLAQAPAGVAAATGS